MRTAPIILIADGTDDALKYLQEELATADYTLLHAKDGREALSLLETHPSPITFAVVELELPGVNGLHLIGRLTSQEPKPKKIIATTFLEDEVLFELAKHMGADVIVQKPRPWEMAPLFRPATPNEPPVLHKLSPSERFFRSYNNFDLSEGPLGRIALSGPPNRCPIACDPVTARIGPH